MSEFKLLKSLSDLYIDLLELDAELEKDSTELAKGANYWKDKNPAKYKKMLAKLARDRKTVGHKERATQQVLQAKRREKGGSGTTAGQKGHKGHKSGHMKTKTGSAAKRYAAAEKKAGQKMSIDRKNNDKGYESSNTRLAPQSLNRGDENNKKKKEWYKKKGKKK
jgi:hypothetical protein